MKIYGKNTTAQQIYKKLSEVNAGIVLTAFERKCIIANGFNVKPSYVSIDKKNEVWLINAGVDSGSLVKPGDFEPNRKKKLLLTKRQIEIIKRLDNKELYIIPWSVFSDRQFIKIQLAICEKSLDGIDNRHKIEEDLFKREKKDLF